MASGIYWRAREAVLRGEINLLSDTIKATLIDVADYTVSFGHQFISDVPSGARIATGTLASKSVANGVFDATDLILNTVTGDTAEAVIIWKDTGVEGSSPLLAYIDSGLGFPYTPDGGTLIIAWPGGPYKIFAIT